MPVTNPNFAVRGGVAQTLAEGVAPGSPPAQNVRGETLVAQGLPPNTMLTSLGRSYWASTTTAAAPVIAIPTTAALIGLWNGESGAQAKSYVIDSVFVVVVAATAAVQAVGILANVSTQGVQTALANTITPRGLLANRPYVGTARVAVGITLDATNGVAANWMPLGTSSAPSNTTQIGQTLDIDVKGEIIIPPGGQLALSVLSGAATASSVQVGVRWHELYLPAAV